MPQSFIFQSYSRVINKMAQSMLSGFIYLAIASIILSSVFLGVIHGTTNCLNNSVIYTGVGACNGSNGFGTRGTANWSAAEIALYSVVGLAGVIALLMAAFQLGGVL